MKITSLLIVLLTVILTILIFVIIGLKVLSGNETRLNSEDDFITGILKKRQEMIRKAGFHFKATTYFAGVIGLAILITLLAYFLSGNLWMVLFAAAAVIILPRFLLQTLSNRHSKAFEERFSRSLKQLASSLSAGRSIIQSVDDVANCKYVNEQLRKEYLSMSNSLRLGIPVTQAFRNFADSVASQDAADVALAIEVQNEIGGHEAETVLEIANNIQDRIILRKEVKTIFSSTSSMIKIMNFVVPACMLVFALTNTSYIETYFSSPMLILTFFVLLGLPFLGIYLTSKMLKDVTP